MGSERINDVLLINCRVPILIIDDLTVLACNCVACYNEICLSVKFFYFLSTGSVFYLFLCYSVFVLLIDTLSELQILFACSNSWQRYFPDLWILGVVFPEKLFFGVLLFHVLEESSKFSSFFVQRLILARCCELQQ